jgi:hypothetical protein
MRLVALGVLLLAGSTGQALAEWRPSVFEGESKRAIQGCAARSTDDAWSCAFIRCEPGNNRLGLYLDIPGVLAPGPITLAVDGRDFPLTLQDSRGPFGDAYRLLGADPEMFTTLARGRSLRIRQAGIKPGYDVIALAGLGPALSRLNRVCTRR